MECLPTPGFAPSSQRSFCNMAPRPWLPPLPLFNKPRRKRPREADSPTQGCTAKKRTSLCLEAPSLYSSVLHSFPGNGQAGAGRRGGGGWRPPPVTSACPRPSSCFIHLTPLPQSELSGGRCAWLTKAQGCGEWMCRRGEEFASRPGRSAVWMAAQHTARQLFSKVRVATMMANPLVFICVPREISAADLLVAEHGVCVGDRLGDLPVARPWGAYIASTITVFGLKGKEKKDKLEDSPPSSWWRVRESPRAV